LSGQRCELPAEFFTKIADIGSDLMKIVSRLRKMNARNPGVIADARATTRPIRSGHRPMDSRLTYHWRRADHVHLLGVKERRCKFSCCVDLL